jgi:hypothetical protein
MNIDEVQRRLWEQSQAHRQLRESGTPLFPTNPYGGRIRNLMDLMHKGRLTINLGRCGHAFFDNGITDEVNDLLIHEYGHHYSSNHLDAEYYRALTSLGARMVRLALAKPELFR